MAESNLSPKQQAFVDEYLVDLNATQAAIRAGYSERTAKQQGARLLTKADVIAAVKAAQSARAERTELTADEVINDLRELRDICMGRKSAPKSIVIDGAPMDVDVTEVNPAGAARSLELLGKHLTLFTDKHEHTGKNGGPIETAATVVFEPVDK